MMRSPVVLGKRRRERLASVAGGAKSRRRICQMQVHPLRRHAIYRRVMA